jgi:hypothetical protein
MRLTVVYMKVCVYRDMNLFEFRNMKVDNSWLHEAVCRKRHEMWLTVGYMKPCVYRNIKCG